MTGRLTTRRLEALRSLAKYPDGATAYVIANDLFGEPYGIVATRARGRLSLLKQDGLATNDAKSGVWRITPAGRRALKECSE
jgi:hypothetical protein